MNIYTNWRDRSAIMSPIRNPYTSYHTDTKSSMKKTFVDDMFLNNFPLGPDVLRKNLADTIVTQEKMAPKNSKMMLEKEMKEEQSMPVHEDGSPLSGISNFISGVMNVISNVMFTKRKPDEFGSSSGTERASPSMWHNAKLSDENKILQDENFCDDMSSEFFASEMSDCRSAAAHCQSKLDQVRSLLGTNKPQQCSLRVRKRPKRVFVEPTSVEDCFEDAFSPEDFENLANNSYIEFYSSISYHDHTFHDIDSPKIKVESPLLSQEDPTTPTVVRNHTEVETSKMVAKTHSAESVVSDVSTAVCKPDSKNRVVSDELPKVMPDNHLVYKSTENEKVVPEVNTTTNKLHTECGKEVVEACEDKITKLRSLLQGKCKKSKTENPTTECESVTTAALVPEVTNTGVLTLKPEPRPLVTLPPRPKPSSKVKDKKFKNPNRCTEKRRKTKIKKCIEEDVLFANEINSEDLSSSIESSPSTNFLDSFVASLSKPVQNVEVNKSQPMPVPAKDFFDEVSGCFHSGSVESDDSFQIVFHDSPRGRQASDCESEDFDIIFEDSPDSCYTSTDVFGDSDDSTDSDEYDSDSDTSDSGCNTFKLSASLSKSVCNLADDSLYVDHSEDEVDCANIQDLTICDSVADSEIGDTCETRDSKGVLLDERKKLLRKKLPAKRVRFSPNPPKVHVMRVWLFAAKQTRVRYWQQFAVDRERFKRRIADVDMAVSWVLKPQHRSRIMFQRFMPWWNAQKRKEIAEKKEREAQEKLKEEERLRNEEVERQNAELQDKNETDKNVTDENTDTGIISLSQDEKRYSGDGKLENNDSFKTPISTVEIRETDAKVSLDKDRVSEEKGRENDNLIIEEIDSILYENAKNSNKTLDKKLYGNEIVPLNDKSLTLGTGFGKMHPECVSLNT